MPRGYVYPKGNNGLRPTTEEIDACAEVLSKHEWSPLEWYELRRRMLKRPVQNERYVSFYYHNAVNKTGEERARVMGILERMEADLKKARACTCNKDEDGTLYQDKYSPRCPLHGKVC